MNKCKNCGKEIQDNLAYCNEQCLKEHLQKKKAEKEKNPAKPDSPEPESFKDYVKRRETEKENPKPKTEKPESDNYQDKYQIHSGSGSTNRSRNILMVREMIKDKLTEKEITQKLNLYFTSEKVQEYLRVAKEA